MIQPAWQPWLGFPPLATIMSMHGFAADLFRMVDPAVTEVFGRQAAGLVEDIDQNVGAVNWQTLAADRVIEQRLGENPGLLS